MNKPSISYKLYVKHCSVCNKEFSYTAYLSAEKKQPRATCSKVCQYRLVSKSGQRRVERVCKNCSKTYSTIPCFRKVFCSKKCLYDHLSKRIGEKNPAWRPVGEKSSYRSLRLSVRKEIMDSGYVCEDCLQKNDVMEVHHVDKNRHNDDPSNLVVLCKPCHANRHKGERAYNLILKSENHSKKQRRARKACEYCGKEFLIYNPSLRFCSRKCAGVFNNAHLEKNRKMSLCVFCGTEFVTQLAQKRKFCSFGCYTKSRLAANRVLATPR